VPLVCSKPLQIATDEGVETLIAADVFDSLSRFFDSPLWTVLRVLIIIFLILMWLALGVWVYKDARRRNSAPGYPKAMAAMAILIPYFGPLLYIAVRPSETAQEQRDRRLETEVLERQSILSCPDCHFPTEPSYLACPSCARKLKDPCNHCGQPVDPRWALCPFCEKVPASIANRAAREAAELPAAEMPAISPGGYASE
jgi:hypothetical protein